MNKDWGVWKPADGDSLVFITLQVQDSGSDLFLQTLGICDEHAIFFLGGCLCNQLSFLKFEYFYFFDILNTSMLKK